MTEIEDLYEKFNFGPDRDKDPGPAFPAIIENQQLLFEANRILERKIEKLSQDLLQMVSRFYHIYPDYGSPTIGEMMSRRTKKSKPSSEDKPPLEDSTLKAL